MLEGGSLNPSNSSLNTEDRDGAITLKNQGKKNEQSLQNETSLASTISFLHSCRTSEDATSWERFQLGTVPGD